ncbi:MAG: serine hydrolase [Candidatus Saccharibacteria bacterium]
MIKDWSVNSRGWLAVHWKRILIFGGGGLLVFMLLVQFFYPADRLLPFTSIENVAVGGWHKKDAVWQLDQDYAKSTTNVYFGLSKTAYRTPQPKEIGITVHNQQRIEGASYPWYLRIVPTSLFWGHWATGIDDTPSYTHDSKVLGAYIGKELGDSCSVLAKDAGLKVDSGKLALQKSSDGGTCTIADVTTKLANAKYSLKNDTSVTVPVKIVPPAVKDSDAQAVADKVSAAIANGINVKAGSSEVLIPKDQLVGWLDFNVVDGKLDYSFNLDRASAYLTTALAAKVAVGAGVTKVSTYDFVETSRQNGANGQTLDKAGTLASLKSFVSGTVTTPVAATGVVAPSISYVRSYSASHVGLSALMQHYAEDHPGTYGVAMTELSGQYRRATYNAGKSYTTASTYKLFVAYSSLKRVEAGTWHWTDQINGGRDLATCFDDMIVKSDNACASALLTKIGYSAITNEAHAIGCANTSFMGSNGIKTTPEDLALLLAMLQTGQVLDQQASRDRWINAMERNVYRQGIPKGANGTVADKVGFMDSLLHDAAIVYSPTGPYVLVIMTDGSSWANIAELTAQIEALRIQ